MSRQCIRKVNHVFLSVTLGLSVMVGVFVLSTGSASANDSSGFRYGVDSSCPVSKGTAPYANTFDSSDCGGSSTISINGGGGSFGGYLGSQDNYATSTGDCSSGYDDGLHTWNATEAGHAGTNAGDNDGFGDAVVYYAGGPGADPNYTPSGYSNTMAYNWGAQQGEDAYSQWLTDSDNSNYSMMPIVWLDMEQTNGWNEWLSTPANGDPPTVTNPCQTNGNYPSDCCNASYDWNVVSGFIFGVGYSSGGGVIGGVYSSYDMWNSETFGCGSC
jgi:hypothetical protein